MKKIAFVFAFSAFTILTAKAAPLSPINGSYALFQDNKKEIDAEDLPKAVKKTILESKETKAVPIYKAYELTNPDSTITYKISFGLEEPEFSKTYDEEGNEVND
ncbi:hypothetical protein IFO69_16200 [Echinicola sp. CAU 1574]|uniref:Beta-lactamase-inhibitor-like PepSY-like domain-containing protein n=1 Tax=Echinicola arenosa TaxID=2774144 RepID=A0ABR9AQS2_9BACT|nr:hypothetical protein [Echinicola arenosa]MBD8490295.1 hypothetical protein [Echinicola arenosa]